MPIYDYKCKACEYFFEEEISIKKYKRKKKCPSCGKHKLERVIGASTVCIRAEAKTLVHLAERNTEKMGSYELGDRRGEQQEAAAKGKKIADGDKPWYHKKSTATSEEINKMTPSQKKKYIEEGKK